MDEDADTGGAERAFEALRAEMAALRQAVEGQTAPDYALTLGVIAKELQEVSARLTAMEASPQLRATPADVARQVQQEASRLAEGQVAQAVAAREGFERGQETLGRVAFFGWLGMVGQLGGLADAGGYRRSGLQTHRCEQSWSRGRPERGHPAWQRLCRRTA
jgi:hypothetical protein